MSTIRYDQHAHYIVQNGCIVRPFKWTVTSHKVGDKVKAHHVSQSSIHKVGGERWVACGLSKESCNSEGAAYVSPPQLVEHGGYHP